jgi:hypothetical protein
LNRTFYRVSDINSLSMITKLSDKIINIYSNSLDYKIRKKDEYIRQCTDILGNLLIYSFIPYWYTKNRKNVHAYSIPQGMQYYDKNSNIKSSTFENIQNNNLSYNMMKACVDTMLKLNMVYKITGVKDVFYSKFYLKRIEDWNWDLLFKNDLILHLEILSLFYDTSILSKVYNKKYVCVERYPASSVVHLQDIDAFIPMDDDVSTVDAINKGFIDNNLDSFKYTRIYSDMEYFGGRFYSLFTKIPKPFRKRLMEFHNYKEIDYSSMILNSMSVYNSNDYLINPYDCLLDALIKKKNTSEVFKAPLKEYIKQATIIAFNSFMYSEESKSLNVLFTSIGLLNTKEEKRLAKLMVKSFVYSNLYFVKLHEVLYDMRKIRWEKNVSKEIKCPNWILSSSAYLKILKKELKSIQNFIGVENWSWTQFMESECLVELYKDLEKDGILPFFIHDAFYVPEQYKEKYVEKANIVLRSVISTFREVYHTKENIDKELVSFKEFIRNLLDVDNSLSKRGLKKQITIQYNIHKDKILNYVKNGSRIFVFSHYDIYDIKDIIYQSVI